MYLDEEPREAEETPKSNQSASLAIMALVALLCLHFCANIWWLLEDHHPIRTDEEEHMRIAREYYDVLAIQEHADPVRALIAFADVRPGYPAHPPLLQILGALCVMAFSYSPDIIAFTDTILFMLMLIGCFLLARTFLEPWPALFTVLTVSLTPIVFASSRYFMTDFLSAVIVVWAMYALIKSDYYKNTGWVFFFAVLNGLGILTRTVTFLYYLVPCAFLVLGGLVLVCKTKTDKGFDWPGLRLWTLNCAMTLVVTAGIFGPWYLHHLDTFNTYWTVEHNSGRGTPLASEMTSPEPPVAPVLSAALPAKPRVVRAQMIPTPEAPSWLSGFLGRFEHPKVPWNRYVTYVINNGVFLPLFVLGFLGIPLGFLSSRFRSLPLFLVLLWLVGSYVLLTLLFNNSTARYALPAVPALAIFAALAVLSPPWKGLSVFTSVVLALFLVFQYGNLTVKAYGDQLARVTIPAEFGEDKGVTVRGMAAPYLDAWALETYHDGGLVVYKDTLTLSDAYTRLAAPVGMDRNFKDRIFRAMAAYERNNRAALEGQYANFLQLNIRGMEFDQQHYWPQPNPYATRDWAPGEFPARRFKSLGLEYGPDPLLQKLSQASYVVYAIEAAKTDVEVAWQQLFTERGFQLIEAFSMERMGQVPPMHYGVLARKFGGEAVAVRAAEDIDTLGIDELYDFATRPGFAQLPEDMRTRARERFQTLLNAPESPYRANVYTMNESAAYLWSGATKVGENQYQFRFLFRVTAPFTKDLTLYFRGAPLEETLAALPEDQRNQGTTTWDFAPVPPTSEWNVSDFPYIFQTHTVEALPGPYRLELGFQDGDSIHIRPVQIPRFDFGSVQ